MNYEILTALVVFSFVSSITPGPNNLMLMASGANFGLMKTIPHMLGVALGFTLMVVLVGLGMMQIFEWLPYSDQLLKIFSVVYLLYLAYKIAVSASPNQSNESTKKPMTFLQAALFQWVNPKAWTMALTAISVYAPTQSTWSVFLVAAIFGTVNLPSVGVWAILGQQMTKVLTSIRRMQWFNRSMALLLVASLYPVVFG